MYRVINLYLPSPPISRNTLIIVFPDWRLYSFYFEICSQKYTKYNVKAIPHSFRRYLTGLCLLVQIQYWSFSPPLLMENRTVFWLLSCCCVCWYICLEFSLGCKYWGNFLSSLKHQLKPYLLAEDIPNSLSIQTFFLCVPTVSNSYRHTNT